MTRTAWFLLAALVIAQPARAQVFAPCGGFVTHVWVPQPSGHVNISIPGGSYSGGGSHPGTPAPGNGGGGNGGGSHQATPVGGGTSGGGGNSGGGPSGGGGGGDGAVVLLVLAVAAAVALPVVVWAFDEDARPDVVHCWWAPEERFSLYGGTTSELRLSGFLGAKGQLRLGVIGLDGALEGNSEGFGTAHGALLVRIPPKQHVEFAVSLGGRRLVTPLGSQSYLELGLPQRYAPFRWNALNPGLSFELRPAVLLSPAGAFDVRLDAMMVFPLGPWASIDIGARAYSFQGAVQGGGVFGFQLSL